MTGPCFQRVLENDILVNNSHATGCNISFLNINTTERNYTLLYRENGSSSYMTVTHGSCQVIMTSAILLCLTLRIVKCHNIQFISMELNQVMNIILMRIIIIYFLLKIVKLKTLMVRYLT